ncbi:unnamed protein product [Dicrocoelium dendriticum]|nr:unnamed protein product [Dicrocoelium dendriticum]
MRHYKLPDVREQRRKSFVPQDLQRCPFVFLRLDGLRRPLERPYEGPFKVLQRKDRVFIIDRHGKREAVTIDRLKVAHVEPELNEDPYSSSDESTQPMMEDSTASNIPDPKYHAPSKPSTSAPPLPIEPTATSSAVPPILRSDRTSKTTPSSDSNKSTRSGRRVHWPARLRD